MCLCTNNYNHAYKKFKKGKKYGKEVNRMHSSVFLSFAAVYVTGPGKTGLIYT